MHRRPLLDMLTRYRQANPGEADVLDRICSLVENYVDCFERTCRPGHITGSSWILSSDRTRCLLTHHRKLSRWLQLGGHADGQTRVEFVALREAKEESGMRGFDFVTTDGELLPLDIDVHDIPARFDQHGNLLEDAHEHHDIRFLLIARDERSTIQVSHESYDLAWFTPERVLEITSEESVLRMLRKAMVLAV